uniref:Uncharacterized protein n=1 Tax=Arundo donax TaxID=35708 RepID=A0A0A9C515_ARUDO
MGSKFYFRELIHCEQWFLIVADVW